MYLRVSPTKTPSRFILHHRNLVSLSLHISPRSSPTTMQQRRVGGRPNRQPRRGDTSTSSPSSHRTQHRPPPPYPSSVPSHASLTPNLTPVSIILKRDQPTGTQVQGIVAEILTRSDHPRGVKVRLRDGRVGRVQRVVSEEEGRRGEESVGGAGAGLGRDGESRGGGDGSQRGGRGRRGGSSGRGRFRHVEDVRGDDGYLYEEAAGSRGKGDEGWFRALEEADARYAEERMGGGGGSGVGVEVATCPVCGVFEGDERAVAHHVEGHFGG